MSFRVPRNTFGIYYPGTKNMYPDILSAHLQIRNLSKQEWLKNSYLQETEDRHKAFHLLIDHKVQRELLKTGNAKVIVSFQVRKDGNYAIARLFQTNVVQQPDSL